jgi:hypothetical protein
LGTNVAHQARSIEELKSFYMRAEGAAEKVEALTDCEAFLAAALVEDESSSEKDDCDMMSESKSIR